MSALLPVELEICARIRDGHPCKDVIFRPKDGVIYCRSCGGTDPGIVYVRKDATGWTHAA